MFATWGPLDLLELQRNISYYQLIPLSDGPIKFYDVQKLFSLEAIKEKDPQKAEIVANKHIMSAYENMVKNGLYEAYESSE